MPSPVTASTPLASPAPALAPPAATSEAPALVIPLAPVARVRQPLVAPPAPTPPAAAAANTPWVPKPYGPPYIERPEVNVFIAGVAGKDEAYAKELRAAFAKVPQRMQPNPNAPPSGEDLPFDTYMNIFNKPEDLARGVAFARAHQATLELAAKRYGVDPQIILGILNVETKYGTHPDRVPVLDALVQRAFDSTRTAYFRDELVSFLQQAHANNWNLATFMGSTAGAFGIPQFMPSNVPRYGVSAHPPAAADMFDPDDAILSVGNFLQHAAGTPYRSGEPAAVELAGPIAALKDKQSVTVGELRRRGFALPAALADNIKGAIFRYTPAAHGADRAMFLGPNATIIKSYNNDRTYAAATYLLGVMVYDQWKRDR